jgi:uncharacterized RDD family membrane protein YckC
MYCTQCGNALAEGAAFCRRCGQPVANSPFGSPFDATQAPASFAEPPVSPIESFPPPAVSTTLTASRPYAGFWLRLVAYLIDKAILSIAFGAMIAVAIAFVGWDRIRQGRSGLEVRMAPFEYLSLVVQREFDYRGQFDFFTPRIFGAIATVLLAMMIVTWLYYAFMESSSIQGTLGKMVLGLIVTDMHGSPISFGRASGRFFARFITGLVPLFIGYIMAGFTEKKQALHDIIAGCLVLQKS